jgi:uncharacterized membrane protein YuzA (DUF378 family)
MRIVYVVVALVGLLFAAMCFLSFDSEQQHKA